MGQDGVRQDMKTFHPATKFIHHNNSSLSKLQTLYLLSTSRSSLHCLSGLPLRFALPASERAFFLLPFLLLSFCWLASSFGRCGSPCSGMASSWWFGDVPSLVPERCLVVVLGSVLF